RSMADRLLIDAFLRVTHRSGDGRIRLNEPVTGGIPLPPGACVDVDRLRFVDETGRRVPAQAVISERWPDGSVRWLLVDLRVDSPSTCRIQLASESDDIVLPRSIAVRRESGRLLVDSGQATFIFDRGDDLFTVIDSNAVTVAHVRIVAIDAGDRPARVRIDRVDEETAGALRTTVIASGTIELESHVLELMTRFHLFAESPVVRAEVRVRNPRRAAHPGNFWELGDANSTLFRDVSIQVDLPTTVSGGMLVVEPENAPVQVSAPAVLYQESSGGDRW